MAMKAKKKAVAKRTAPKRVAKKAAAKRSAKKKALTGTKALRNWFKTVWNDGKLDEGFASLAHPDIVFHSLGMTGGPLVGLEGFRKHYNGITDAFSGANFVLHDIVEAGDKAAVRWSATLDHTKHAFGPPTGKTVTVSGMAFIRMKNGKVAETWDEWSRMELLKQLNLPIP